jgi:hypothetical protein
MRLRLVLACVGVLGLAGACGGAAAPKEPEAAARQATQASAASTVPDALANQLIDVYDAATGELTIPLVQVGIGFYKDVRITVPRVLAVGSAQNTSGVFDRYAPLTGELTIPVVRVGSALYYNARIEVGNVLSVGDAVASYSVPVDLTKVSYPGSYRTITTSEADINTDPCNLNLTVATYPASWLGQYPLPAIKGAPLKPAIKRAVNLKDIGLNPGNPAFIAPGAPGAPNGCTGDTQAALAKTAQRLRTLGTEYITIPQYHWISGRADGSWYMTRAEDSIGSITDADLAYLVQQAHALGIKVIMKNLIAGYKDGANPAAAATEPAPTPENLQNYFAAYQAMIGERSVFFQSIGLDVWEVGCGACLFQDTGDGSAASIALFASEYAKALDTMKLVFKGQTMMTSHSWLHEVPSLLSRIDIVCIGLWQNYPPDSALTVEAYKAFVINSGGLQYAIDYWYPGKTVMIEYGAQSRRNYFSLPGYVEEVVCTAAPGALNGSADSCIQRETQPDFSLQAIVHEATLEALNELVSTSTLIVQVVDYESTDSLMPFTGFPELGTTVRNKPAEGIVKAWFAR